MLTQLLSASTRQAIVDYLDNVSPLLPVMVDDTTYVRHWRHNDQYLSALHHQLTDVASDVFRTRVKPSYCFLSMYKDSAICPLHVDRPPCRYTIDYLIRQDQVEPWPLCIADEMTDELYHVIDQSGLGYPSDEQAIKAVIDDQSWHTVDLQPNDAVCYSGTNSWHYRPNRLVGTADLVFFHFVPEGFDGPLN